MFKKNRSREPAIGNPTLVATTFDNKTLQAMSPIASPGANAVHAQHHQRQPSDRHAGPGLPPLPFKSMEPNALRENPHSRPPVASSIYSQRESYPVDMATRYAAAHHPQHQHSQSDAYTSGYRDSEYEDISPPDSPIRTPTGPYESPDISPIDNISDQPQHFPVRRTSNRYASALPVPRKDVMAAQAPQPPTPHETSGPSATSRLKPTSPAQNPNRLTRWDDFSGEPTESEKGKPAQVRPGSKIVKETPTSKQQSKSQFNFLAKGKELNQARRKFMESRRQQPDKNDIVLAPPAREPWKGASGRNPLVTPIESKKGTKLPPLNIPPRKDSVSTVERKSVPGQAAGGLPPLTVGKSREPGSVPADPSIKPIVPLKAGANTPTSARHPSSTPTSRSVSGAPARPENTYDNQPVHHPTQQPEPDYAANLQNVSFDPEPYSRFSVTTYATTEPGSPPQTPRPDQSAPPVPTVPAAMRIKATTRKPTPSEISTSTSATKTLPRSPPEMEARNRIDAMEAKLNDLARRKANIDTIIHELTQVIQPSSVAYDMMARNEVKKSVASLNNELDEIRKEEHEVGMKLMRARKKQDEGLYYEASSIWVKRVTNG
ncbi:hypothetical protein FQN53_005286 [Emmonsiellopsis sp. PD_33]|nr:hypothetical protein FQN53_005286 [Emmonsiellopsis sp. PD_33]